MCLFRVCGAFLLVWSRVGVVVGFARGMGERMLVIAVDTCREGNTLRLMIFLADCAREAMDARQS